MRSSESVRVRLFGRDYSVKGHGDKEYVKEIVDFINERAAAIRSQSTTVSTLDLVILTLLNITDEMFRDRVDKERIRREFEAKEAGILRTME